MVAIFVNGSEWSSTRWAKNLLKHIFFISNPECVIQQYDERKNVSCFTVNNELHKYTDFSIVNRSTNLFCKLSKGDIKSNKRIVSAILLQCVLVLFEFSSAFHIKWHWWIRGFSFDIWLCQWTCPLRFIIESQSLVLYVMFCRSLFVLLSCWPLCCLFFDLRILITPFVSLSSSYTS
jgi:hypothetical protein